MTLAGEKLIESGKALKRRQNLALQIKQNFAHVQGKQVFQAEGRAKIKLPEIKINRVFGKP